MWKITIRQKTKSTFSEAMLSNDVEFVAKDITVLTALVDRLAECEGAVETSYKIEKVGAKNE